MQRRTVVANKFRFRIDLLDCYVNLLLPLLIPYYLNTWTVNHIICKYDFTTITSISSGKDIVSAVVMAEECSCFI